MRIGIRERFSAAHRLLGEHVGRCAQLHGHTYGVEVEVEGPVSPEGWVIDFGVLRREVRAALPDHEAILATGDAVGSALEMLNFAIRRTVGPPTAEAMVVDLARLIQARLTDAVGRDVMVVRVRLEEGPDAWAEWRA